MPSFVLSTKSTGCGYVSAVCYENKMLFVKRILVANMKRSVPATSQFVYFTLDTDRQKKSDTPSFKEILIAFVCAHGCAYGYEANIVRQMRLNTTTSPIILTHYVNG